MYFGHFIILPPSGLHPSDVMYACHVCCLPLPCCQRYCGIQCHVVRYFVKCEVTPCTWKLLSLPSCDRRTSFRGKNEARARAPDPQQKRRRKGVADKEASATGERVQNCDENRVGPSWTKLVLLCYCSRLALPCCWLLSPPFGRKQGRTIRSEATKCERVPARAIQMTRYASER